MKEEVLYLENLVTDQPSGQNLDYVSLSLNRGEILGITGLSDSGISALADVLVGLLRPCSGSIYLDGDRVFYDSEAGARARGIYGISYGSATISGMSVAENLNVLREFRWHDFIIPRRVNREITHAIFEQYGIHGNADGKAADLTVGQCMEVSICRALLCGARVLVCREVGEGFSEGEQKEFIQFLHQIRDEGIPVITINSDVIKVLQYADRVAVMRNGFVCYEANSFETASSDIYRRLCFPMMHPAAVRHRAESHRLVTLQDLSLEKTGVTLSVLKIDTGMSVGILENSSGNFNALYQMFTGTVQTKCLAVEDGRIFSFFDWRRKNARWIYCLGSRFWERGLYENLTAAENILLRSMNRFDSRLGLLNQRMLSLALRDFCSEHGIDAECLQRYPRHLSVELRNQIVLLGALFAPPRLLVLDHPFYTVDEQVKRNLLRCLEELKMNGTAILCVSNNESMLNAACDTVILPDRKE